MLVFSIEAAKEAIGISDIQAAFTLPSVDMMAMM
jgi:hypothetical protein